MDVPRDDLYRAVARPAELREDSDGDGRTLFGHFAVFDVWTEIHSWFEGDFVERLAHGSFAKTMAERRDQVKVLYDHGYDSSTGNKVLGPIRELHEDGDGAYYEVGLLDAGYVNELLPGLRAGLYGASFRFNVLRDEWDEEPGASDHNLKALPERTIKEVRLLEFGPVTFPAYADATAGVRSLSDRYHEHRTRPHLLLDAGDAPRNRASAPLTHPLAVPFDARRRRLLSLRGHHMEEAS